MGQMIQWVLHALMHLVIAIALQKGPRPSPLTGEGTEAQPQGPHLLSARSDLQSPCITHPIDPSPLHRRQLHQL